MTVFDQAFENYTYHNELTFKDEWDLNDPFRPSFDRIGHLSRVTNALKEHFKFDTINCIETGGSWQWIDGMVGYYFAFLANNTNGQFQSVDINPDLESRVYEAYNNIDPNIQVNHTTDDSLNLLKNPPFIPYLVHLDSWDVDLKDPFPSALHGWREFEAIESQMPVGSIIIIDDNWYKAVRDRDWERIL